ncbi:MAG: hypothetical protein KTV72_03200 [Wolbachia endosymbiont of Melophagus ovinus]|nr:hypothetical protein [Wolbachia endosymbiont of Melophagus ovinus]
MWKSIKKFFEWIADHTGISWIARKISSGWKWLFGGKANATQNASQQEGSPNNKKQEPAQEKTLDNQVNPDQSPAAPDGHQGPVTNASETDAEEVNTKSGELFDVGGGRVIQPSSTTTDNQYHSGQTHSNSADSRCGKPPVISSISENQKGVLELFVEKNHTGKIFGDGLVGIAGNADLNHTEIVSKLKYRAYIKCEKGEVFQITCGKLIESNGKGAFLSIESIASQDGKDSSSELEGMKNMLGLSEKRAVIAVTQISKDPITVPKTVEGNTPSSKATSPGAQSHTTGNDRPVNA